MPEETTEPIVSFCFNDKNLAPDVQLPTKGANVYNLESRQLIDSAYMRNLMGDEGVENFIFENGFYPRIKDETHLAASPILLYPGENADSVVMPFYVDTSYGVYWYSHDYRVIRIEGNIGYVRHPIKETTTVKIEAHSNREYENGKHVYLTVPASRLVYQDLKADTVCPGDSVRMITSYARNEGWNYEVVETASAEYDTIYRMYLHHHPTYKEVVHRAAVERDSLPYIYGKDTIRNFGLTELRRHQTVHGCDSILYVQLDTLYVHRERHFRDSLHTCAGSSLYWRGKTITEAGDYTDTVFDPYKGGTDSVYHLRAAVHPVYSDTLYLSVERDSMPYIHNGTAIREYGLSELHRYRTEHGCDSIIYVQLDTLYVHRERHFRDSARICGGDTLSWRGRRIDRVGVYTDTVRDMDKGGTDSIFRLTVREKRNAARIAVVDTVAPLCDAEEITFSYLTETGTAQKLRLIFDPAAHAAGFRDTTLAIAHAGRETVRLPLPPTMTPDRYSLNLWQADATGCYAQDETLTFEIPYSSSIIVQKWNDVLAVLSSEYNGGYEFTGYQWYRNGEPLEGETKPYYYAKPYLRSTDTYAVLLQRASDGLRLKSCPVKRKAYPKAFVLELLPNPTASDGEVLVRVSGRPEAEGTIEVFDNTGRPVYSRPFQGEHTLRATWQPGTYVVRVKDAKGLWTASGKLLVR